MSIISLPLDTLFPPSFILFLNLFQVWFEKIENSDSPDNNHLRNYVISWFYFDNYRFDVALLRLDRPVNYRANILPICLPSDPDADYEGLMGVVAGWGKTDTSYGNVHTP